MKCGGNILDETSLFVLFFLPLRPPPTKMRKSSVLLAVGAACVCGTSAFTAPVGMTAISSKAGPRLPMRVSTRRSVAGDISMNAEHDILLRAARSETTDRSPVWLMRQAGRYMKAFREFSDKYPFRKRSETPEIAIELSLQPFEAFGTDGVIMFSDILTPLPSMGIEFDVVKGSGPVIFDPIRSMDQVQQNSVAFLAFHQRLRVESGCGKAARER